MDLGLAGKIALITGGARGIGAAIATLLAEEGAKIVVVDITAEAAEAKAKEIQAAGGEAIGVAADITIGKQVEAMTQQAVERFGAVDILVNNAGFQRDMRIGRMGEEEWDAVVDVILKGAFLCSKAVTPIMSERGWGRIINMSSRAHLGNPGQVNYSAGKAGLLGFTRALSMELGRFNITVNSVAPGLVGTEAVRNLAHFANVQANAEKTTPIPRIGTPEDIAGAVAFLASERAGYISGEVLHVTGGRY